MKEKEMATDEKEKEEYRKSESGVWLKEHFRDTAQTLWDILKICMDLQ